MVMLIWKLTDSLPLASKKPGYSSFFTSHSTSGPRMLPPKGKIRPANARRCTKDAVVRSFWSTLPPPCPAGFSTLANRGGLQRDVGEHQEPALGHLLHGVAKPLPPVPRLLRPSIGHLVRPEGGDVVDDDPADLQLPVRQQDPADIAGEDAGLQAVPGVVDLAER